MDSRLETPPVTLHHPSLTRRAAIQAGGIGLLGLGMNHRRALQAADVVGTRGTAAAFGKAKACVYIFLSGGLAQHDSFDMKPEAPVDVRGEFQPVATKTPGIQICEHLPRLAECSPLWSLVRSLTHPTNDHSAGHLMMLTGRSQTPPGFNPNMPRPSDWPSIGSLVGDSEVVKKRTATNNLPPAVILPDRLVHYSGRVLPGQFGGQMGAQHDPWIVEAAPFHSKSYGAFPEYQFDHQERGEKDDRVFAAPSLSLPQGFDEHRFSGRNSLLTELETQKRHLENAAQKAAKVGQYDDFRQGVLSLLTDATVRRAFDVTKADEKVQERYGKNAFGWSLLMAKRLVEAGVTLIQVNLGNNESWDTHGEAFPHLKDKLFPPMDRAVSAFLNDLHESGMLDSTLVVMAGEFGRTPKITHLPQHYKLPGRDHWGAVQSVLFAGGGTVGGTVVGASDKLGAFPAASPQTPESMAATIYHTIGIPHTAAWHDNLERPHHLYVGEPIGELFG